MRILIIAPHYNYFVKDQVEAMSELVEEIHVFVKHNSLADLISKVRIPRLSDHAKNYTYKSLINLNKKPPNVYVHVLSFPYIVPDGKNYTLGLAIYKKIQRVITDKKIDFDIIHSHFVYHYGQAGSLIKRKTGIPFVITAHGDDIYDFPFRNDRWRNIILETLKFADHIITVSYRNSTILSKDLGVSGNKISVIPNGFNPNLFKPIHKDVARDYLGLPPDKKIILNVASLVPIKGHDVLITAIKRVVRTREDVLLTIIGNGPLKRKLVNIIKKRNLEKYVRFEGIKPHSEIPLWMNAADLFVLPSLSEGNPTVMFEVLGVGLPFVGTAVGGVPEIITSEDYGLLCPPKDPECLAEKILIALEKEWNREKIRKYAERFTWNNIAKEIVRIYKQISSTTWRQKNEK